MATPYEHRGLRTLCSQPWLRSRPGLDQTRSPLENQRNQPWLRFTPSKKRSQNDYYPAIVLAMDGRKPMQPSYLPEPARRPEAPLDAANIHLQTREQVHGEATRFEDPKTGESKVVFMPRSKTTPYTFNGFSQTSFDLNRLFINKNPSREARRMFDMLQTLLEMNEIEVKTGGLAALGRKFTPLLGAPIPRQHVNRALEELQDIGVLYKQPGARKIIVNPEYCFSGAGEVQVRRVAEWRCWRSAEDRRMKRLQKKAAAIAAAAAKGGMSA